MAMSMEPNQPDISIYTNTQTSEETPDTSSTKKFEERFQFRDSSELPPPEFNNLPLLLPIRSPLTRRTLPRGASTGVFGAKTTFGSQVEPR